MKTLLNILVKAKNKRRRKTTILQTPNDGLRNIYHINKMNANMTFMD